MTENRSITNEDGTETYEQYFSWNSKEKGYVLSAFYYGYVCTQILGGALSQKIGGNLVRKIYYFKVDD
jgi:ACS family sodium-dependent inorganic phosphate cotransporter